MLTEQLVAFRRGCILVKGTEQKLPQGNVALISLIEELGRFGYRLNSEIMVSISEEEIKDVFDSVIPEIRKTTLDGQSITPLYPGFPEQTAGISEQQMRMDQLRCYNGDLEGFLRDNPWTKPIKKSKIRERKYLKLMTLEEFMEIPQRIMSAGNSITPEDKELLKWFLNSYPDLPIQERIPFKEILCIVLEYHPEMVRDINEIVRYGLYRMGANPALPHIPKRIKLNAWRGLEPNPEHRKLGTMKRQTRREIMKMVDEVVSKKGIEISIQDAKKLYGPWVLLSERVHPGEYKKQYPKANEFFRVLKTKGENKKLKTWYSDLQEMYDTGKSVVEITKYISKRPGELVRRFDSLIRRDNYKYSSEVLDIFVDTPGMKNKTLLSFYDYYDRRERGDKRIVFIPGSRYMHELPALPTISSEILQITKNFIWKKIVSNIQSYTKEKDLVGKAVVLDKNIKNILCPVGMRDNQTQIPMGTKFKIPDTDKTVRFFVHWVQKPGRYEDLDLHGYIYNTDKNTSMNIGWNGKHTDQIATYSGDCRNRDGACAEYIDIRIDEASKGGWTHVIASVDNFYGRGFNTLECTLGYMLRGNEKAEYNDTRWFPDSSDIEQSIKLQTGAASIMAFLVDLKDRTVRILDRDLKGVPLGHEYHGDIIKFFNQTPDVTSYDLLKCWYEARGAEVVEEKGDTEKEVIEVSFQDIINDYTIVSQAIGE